MLLVIKDGAGNLQTVCVLARGSTTDRSGAIVATGVAQALMPANPDRSGWLFQNTSVSSPYTITLSEDDGDPTVEPGLADAPFQVGPGEVFPPAGSQLPVPTGQINIAGQEGDTFTCREW